MRRLKKFSAMEKNKYISRDAIYMSDEGRKLEVNKNKDANRQQERA